MNNRVAVLRTGAEGYSESWADQEDFPEKEALRELGRLLGHDDGNPLRGIVEPGQNVVVKPNWVLDFHPNGETIECVVTHSSMLRAVVDLAFEAMGGEGSIVIADAPQFNCDFENLMKVTGARRIGAYYERVHGRPIELRDLRQIASVADDAFIRSDDRIELAGDPEGYAVVDFGSKSAFVGLHNPQRIYGADYDRRETFKHHNADRHEYLVSRTILNADTVIHVPKLKVHKKVGITLNAKGMVGINGNKNWIAHYRVGPPRRGGDEFPDSESRAAKVRAGLMRLAIEHLLVPKSRSRELMFNAARGAYQMTKPLQRLAARGDPELEAVVKGDHMLHGGNWHGNDTAWRMTADLGRAVVFADAEGVVRDTPQRRFFSVVDGIVAGEREGPLAPDPVRAGVLLAGENPLAVDIAGARVIGQDWRKLKFVRWLLEQSPHDFGIRDPAADVEIAADPAEWSAMLRDPGVETYRFEPHPGWVGHVELEQPAAT